jgi:hypothetical protein
MRCYGRGLSETDGSALRFVGIFISLAGCVVLRRDDGIFIPLNTSSTTLAYIVGGLLYPIVASRRLFCVGMVVSRVQYAEA